MLRMIGFELLKLRVQKKNYVMLGGHILFMLLCYLAFRSSQTKLAKRFLRDMSFELGNLTDYFDGFFFARVALIPTFIILMPIAVATIAGDCVAGEMQDGSLKLYVSRPRSRVKIILSKFIAIYGVTLLYSLYFATFNLVVAALLFNISPTQLVMLTDQFFGTDVVVMSLWDALKCYFASTIYFSFSLMAIGSIALFFSTVFNRMSASTVTVISLYFVSYVVGALPFSEEIRPYLLSQVMNNAFLLLMSPIPLQKLMLNLSTLGVYIVGFFFLSILIFNYKDLK